MKKPVHKGPALFIFGSGGVIAFAPAGLSYVGRLRRPRSALFRQRGEGSN